MKTPTRPQTVLDPMSGQLKAARGLGLNLARLRRALGPDLDAAQIVEDFESLDTYLLSGITDPQRYVGAIGDSHVGARYATCTLARMLGAQVADLHEPIRLPKLPSCRELSDVEVLTYRYAAVHESARVTVMLAALEAQATLVELGSTPSRALVRIDGQTHLELAGTTSKRPGTPCLPAWSQARADELIDRDAKWLLTDSASKIPDQLSSVVQNATKRELRYSLGWTAPSARSITLTALRRLARTQGDAVAHRASRNRNPAVTKTAIG